MHTCLICPAPSAQLLNLLPMLKEPRIPRRTTPATWTCIRSFQKGKGKGQGKGKGGRTLIKHVDGNPHRHCFHAPTHLITSTVTACTHTTNAIVVAALTELFFFDIVMYYGPCPAAVFDNGCHRGSQIVTLNTFLGKMWCPRVLRAQRVLHVGSVLVSGVQWSRHAR